MASGLTVETVAKTGRPEWAGNGSQTRTELGTVCRIGARPVGGWNRSDKKVRQTGA